MCPCGRSDWRIPRRAPSSNWQRVNCRARVEEELTKIKRRRTQCAGPLSSGGAELSADCGVAPAADRHGSNAFAPRTQQAAERTAAHEERRHGMQRSESQDNRRRDRFAFVQALETAPDVPMPGRLCTARVMARVPRPTRQRHYVLLQSLSGWTHALGAIAGVRCVADC